MKANTIVLIVIGALLVLTIISIMKLNKVQGEVNKTSSDISSQTPATSVSAGDLVKSLQENMNSVKDINVSFYQKA